MSTIATSIRDAAFDRVKSLGIGGVQFKLRIKAPTFKLQPEQVPALGVFVLNERETPDGDLGVGTPRFINDATISLSGVLAANDPATQEGALDEFVGAAKDRLLCDSDFLDMFEGIVSMQRTYQFPREGDAFYAEARLQITVRFRTTYLPQIPNDLTEIDVTATPNGDADAAFTEKFFPQE